VENDEKLNLYPLIVHCVISEERASFSDILKYVEKTVGNKVNPNAVFSALSKLVEYKILKLNEDTTGTFSLQDWNLAKNDFALGAEAS
jgi:hypothetical protein